MRRMGLGDDHGDPIKKYNEYSWTLCLICDRSRRLTNNTWYDAEDTIGWCER